MNPETLSAPIDNNEASKKELRDQKRAIGKKVLNNGQEHIGDGPEKIMEGYESARDLAKRLGVDLGTIFRVGSKIEGVERQKYKTEAGRDAYYYFPEDVRKIEDKINERAPDDYEDARNIASRLNVDYQTIFNVAKKIPSVERKKFRTESGIEVTYFSPEDVKKIEDRINERAPDGYETVEEIAKHLGTSKQTVDRIIKKLDGVERKDFRTESGVKAYYYSPKDIESIKNERARQVHKKLGSQALKNKKKQKQN